LYEKHLQLKERVKKLNKKEHFETIFKPAAS